MGRTYVFSFLAAFFAGLYKAFVLMSLWNWFVSPIFHISTVSFLQMLVLLWIVQLLVEDHDDVKYDFFWKNVISILEYCVPEENKESVKAVLEQNESLAWSDLGLKVVSGMVGNSVVLALGWAIHAFLV
jgi:hypothetical protein